MVKKKLIYASITSDKNPFYLFTNVNIFEQFINKIENETFSLVRIPLFFTDNETLDVYNNLKNCEIKRQETFNLKINLKIPEIMRKKKNETEIEMEIEKHSLKIKSSKIFIDYANEIKKIRKEMYEKRESQESLKLSSYNNMEELNSLHIKIIHIFTINIKSLKMLGESTLISDLQIAFKRQMLKDILISKYKNQFAFICDEKVFGIGDFNKENQFSKNSNVYNILCEEINLNPEDTNLLEYKKFVDSLTIENSNSKIFEKSIDLLKSKKYDRIGFNSKVDCLISSTGANKNHLNFENTSNNVYIGFIIKTSNRIFKIMDYDLRTQSQAEDMQYNLDFSRIGGRTYKFRFCCLLRDNDKIKDKNENVRLGQVKYKRMDLLSIYDWLKDNYKIFRYDNSFENKPEPFSYKILDKFGKNIELLEVKQCKTIKNIRKCETNRNFNYVYLKNKQYYFIPSIDKDYNYGSSAKKYYLIWSLAYCIFSTIENLVKENKIPTQEFLDSLYKLLYIRYYNENEQNTDFKKNLKKYMVYIFYNYGIRNRKKTNEFKNIIDIYIYIYKDINHLITLNII